jgi:hypothetical protein
MVPVGTSIALLLGDVETTVGALAAGAGSGSSLPPPQLNNAKEHVMIDTIIINIEIVFFFFISLLF